VPFLRPAFPHLDEVERYFKMARERSRYSNSGPCFDLLTTRLEDRTGCACVPVSSGTAALMVAAAALRERGAGSEVLVPSFTFAATVQAMVWNGLEPIFVDVDPDHLHLSPVGLTDALASRGDRVGLVVACSSFGTPPPPAVRQAWEAACRDAGVPLLVDSAAGFGAFAEDGIPIGGQGTAEIVSFHSTKPFGIGEGGAVFTRDRELAERLHRLINFDFGDHRQATTARGLNGKLDELRAAVGLAVLETFDDQLRRRRRLSAKLLDEIGSAFRPQFGHVWGTYQMVPVVLGDDAARARILAAAERQVELRTYYEPLHLMPAFEHVPHADTLEVTETLGRRILSLPMAVDLTDEEIGVIADVCRRGLAG